MVKIAYATTTTTSGVIIKSITYYGLFLYPDDYSGKEVDDNTENWTWDKINSAGIVFLPAAGGRNGDGVSFGTLQPPYPTLIGRYWTSSSGHDMRISKDSAFTGYQQPNFGDSMRLVTDPQ